MSSDEFYNQYVKIKIYPEEYQKEYFDRCINISRFIYNWALGLENAQYESFKSGNTDKQFLTEKDLRKEYKTFADNNPWIKEIGLETARYQISRVVYAFEMFFNHLCEHPQFKSKKRMKRKNVCSITLRHDRFYVDRNKVRITGLKRGTLIDCKYDTGFTKNDKYHMVKLIRDNLGNYYVSFYVDREKEIIDTNNKVIGIDLNGRANRRFVCSDGSIYKAKDTTSVEKRIKKYNSWCQRDRNRLRELEKTNPDAKISNRAKKRIEKFRKANRKIANINENEVQLFTKRVIDKHPSKVVMENLNLQFEMKQKPYIEQFIHFVPLFRYREVMEYKCNQYRIDFQLAARDYPSSQICSKCGNIKKIKSQKIYICPVCGNRIDRDINAAINLSNYCI